ncbi:hypothetical protein B0H66DRAFT_236157 [Apodospora peruviana]|uniref:Uncharacterized protein n=1 Tax=Apodospora peruviana TaxID=516989 RepID=A0AAE0M455_9PEZI|nr:hypothetical protein B0H66DRAFT_236157 [Apodospora peruviana]
MASDMSPVEYERDFRRANTEWRRSKSATVKWSRGARPGAGVRQNFMGEFTSGTETQQAKSRPQKKWSDECSRMPKDEHNIVKARGNWDMPFGRVRNKIHAQTEIKDAATSRSLAELPSPSSPIGRGMSISDNILYSFDRTDSPGRPLTLDIFVKTTGRETERLVEKEYEILDANGEPLKGRKARRHLRKNGTDPGTLMAPEGSTIEDEGFELV